MRYPKLYVERKQVYGNTVYYPACEASKLFARIANTKTLTEHTLNMCILLGYELLEHKQPITLDYVQDQHIELTTR